LTILREQQQPDYGERAATSTQSTKSITGNATTNQIILSLVTEVKKKKHLPEYGQRLTETCWRILRLLKQYDHFNVLF